MRSCLVRHDDQPVFGLAPARHQRSYAHVGMQIVTFIHNISQASCCCCFPAKGVVCCCCGVPDETSGNCCPTCGGDAPERPVLPSDKLVETTTVNLAGPAIWSQPMALPI